MSVVCQNCVPCRSCGGSGIIDMPYYEYYADRNCSDCSGTGVEMACRVCAKELSEEEELEMDDITKLVMYKCKHCGGVGETRDTIKHAENCDYRKD